MTTIPTPELIAQLKRHEGCRNYPYVCSQGRCTIGYGLNLEAHPQYIPDLNLQARVRAGALSGQSLRKMLAARGMYWTEKEAAAVLHAQAVNTRNVLAEKCPQFVRLHDAGEIARAEVLVNMAFNLGVPGLLKFKNTLALIDGALDGVATFAQVGQGMLASLWASQVGVRARELAAQMREGRYGARI